MQDDESDVEDGDADDEDDEDAESGDDEGAQLIPAWYAEHCCILYSLSKSLLRLLLLGLPRCSQAADCLQPSIEEASTVM